MTCRRVGGIGVPTWGAWVWIVPKQRKEVLRVHIRVTTLTENTVTKNGLLAEHGLSMLVEVGDLCLLLDTGQTHTAVHNARALKIDLSKVSHLVLSHGHQDHTGGLRDVLCQVGEVHLHALKDVWMPRYVVRGGEEPRYNGIPFERQSLVAMGATIHLSDGLVLINENVMTTGPIPRVTDFEGLDPDQKIRTPLGWRQDEIPDDQALLIRGRRGMVVLLGCGHSGIVNTLRRAQDVAQEERIVAVLGGTHLKAASLRQVERTIEALQHLGVETLGVSHCTGPAASARLAESFGDRFFYNNVGTVTEWEL